MWVCVYLGYICVYTCGCVFVGIYIYVHVGVWVSVYMYIHVCGFVCFFNLFLLFCGFFFKIPILWITTYISLSFWYSPIFHQNHCSIHSPKSTPTPSCPQNHALPSPHTLLRNFYSVVNRQEFFFFHVHSQANGCILVRANII